MLSTVTSTDSTSSVRIKSLDSRLAPDEQKDLELESEEFESGESANNEAEREEKEDSASSIESELVIHSGLSSRASAIKQYLREKTQVKAILLKEDGSSEEISYDGSSSGTRSLVGGRPSIIGEIEELQVVVIQSLDQSRRSAVNKHTLPVPLCHNQGGGDYVVYRVDSVGSAGDITLEEYQKYVDDHKTLTATSVKNYSVENEQIGSNSPFDSSSKISMESLRGAFEAQIIGESQSVDVYGPPPSKSSIAETVHYRVQKLVDDLVATLSLTPMEDPDYKPEDEGMQFDGDLVIEYDVIDERPWRMQLADAVEHIRLIGKLDGEGFAERILSTMYELNGSSPTLDEMANLYDRIRTDFANEAASELEDEEESEAEIESESESEIESEFEVEVEIEESEWSSVLDIIRSVGRKDGSILASNLCSILYGEYGSEPSLERLTDLWYGIQEELAAEAAEEEEGGDSSDDDEDADYDPDNLDDHFLAELDEAESRRHSIRHFEAESESEDGSEGDDEYEAALDHIRSIGRKDGKALAVDLYDILYEFNAEEPSLEQLTDIWYGVQEQLAVEAEEESDDEEADYDPDNLEDLFLMDQDAEEDSIHQNKYFDADTESDNHQDPEELEEALEHICDVGRMDGQALAENILDILYEVNEEEPSLKELTDLWQSIQNGQDLGAVQETDDSAEDDSDESQDEMSPFEALRFSANTVAADWLSRANSLYLNQKGREPTEDELLATVREFASELADTVIAVESDAESAESAESIESIESAESAESEDAFDCEESVDYTASEAESEQEYESEEESVDGEYDPDNTVDLVQARWDLEADLKFEDQHFDQSTLNTPIVESKRGGGVSWSMYFDEEDLSQQAEAENLQKAIASFKMRNQRVPSILDLKHMAEFLAVPNESCDDEETAAQSKVLALYNTPHFAQSKVLVDGDQEISITTKAVVTKETATGYTLNFDDDYNRDRDSDDEQRTEEAIKWFKRFHGDRDPSDGEMQQIQMFMRADHGGDVQQDGNGDGDEMIDIE